MRKAGFWLTVGAVAIVANFALEFAATQFPSLGFQRFTHFVHGGADQQ